MRRSRRERPQRGRGPPQPVGDRPVELDRLDVPVDQGARVVDPELGEQVRDLAAWVARISSFVSSSQSWRLNGPIAFLRVVYTNCSSVWPALRSSAAFVKHQASICGSDLREGRVVEERVLEPGREVDLGGLDRREAVEQLVGQGRRAVLDRARQPVLAGDDAELPEDLEIELDRRDGAVRKRDTAV